MPVIVLPRPQATVNASLALAPVRPPSDHRLVRKLDRLAMTAAHVLASFGADANSSSAASIDVSMNTIVRRTCT